MRDPEGELRVDHLLTDIGRRSVRGGMVTLGAQLLKVAIQFGVVIVMARLLPPRAFGLIAMVTALNAILDLVKDLGLSAATIQRAEITHAQVTALFWINAALGAAISAALFAASPLIADFYGEPALVPVTRCLAAAFLLSGLTIQHWALLRRQMRFTAVAATETGAEIAGFALAIGLAVSGVGYWALVAQRLVVPAIVLVGCWSLCRWRPGRPRRTPGVRSLLGFGAAVTGSSVAVAITRSIDQILIGWLWGPITLGLYERAAKLLLVPINNINGPLYAVGMPALSRLANEEARFRRGFRQLLEKLAMLTMPGAALVAMTSGWVVALLFGPRWSAAAPIVAWFALAAAYQPTMLGVGLLYLPLNRPREYIRATLIDSTLCILSILAGLHFGPVGVAASFAVVGLAVRMPVYVWLATRRGPVRAIDVYVTTTPSCAAAVAVAVLSFGLRHVLPATLSTPIVGLTVVVPAGILAALAVLYLLPGSRPTIGAAAAIVWSRAKSMLALSARPALPREPAKPGS